MFLGDSKVLFLVRYFLMLGDLTGLKAENNLCYIKNMSPKNIELKTLPFVTHGHFRSGVNGPL